MADLRENLRSSDRQQRFAACCEVLESFGEAWQEQKGQKRSRSARERCEGLRTLLADACSSDNREVVESITLAVLEHLFQDPEILAYFGSWRDHPVLKPIYAEAVGLATGSPIVTAGRRAISKGRSQRIRTDRRRNSPSRRGPDA